MDLFGCHGIHGWCVNRHSCSSLIWYSEQTRSSRSDRQNFPAVIIHPPWWANSQGVGSEPINKAAWEEAVHYGNWPCWCVRVAIVTLVSRLLTSLFHEDWMCLWANWAIGCDFDSSYSSHVGVSSFYLVFTSVNKEKQEKIYTERPARRPSSCFKQLLCFTRHFEFKYQGIIMAV